MSTVGWILGIGSLVHPEDPLVRRLDLGHRAVFGAVEGMRRTWTAGFRNAAPEEDAKHHLDPDGSRPDVCLAFLSADEDPAARIGALALPVDADGLARADARERGYVRVPVDGRFSAPLDGPAWIYRATDEARARLADAHARGRACVSAGYVARVEAAYRARGPAAWRAYRATTDAPPYPLRDLTLTWVGVRPGE